MDINKMSVNETDKWAEVHIELLKLKEALTHREGIMEGMALALNHNSNAFDDEFYKKYEYHGIRYDELWNDYEKLREEARQYNG